MVVPASSFPHPPNVVLQPQPKQRRQELTAAQDSKPDGHWDSLADRLRALAGIQNLDQALTDFGALGKKTFNCEVPVSSAGKLDARSTNFLDFQELQK